MKLFLSILVLMTAALVDADYEPIQTHYHESVGIPEAARIKAAEEATVSGGARIIGGSSARLGQFPFMAGLIITLRNGWISVCGSSLLTTTKLATAAHCWFDGQQNARLFTVVLGSVRLFSGGVRVNTSRVEIHANYNTTTLNNDIAIITITAVRLNNNVNVIQLASGSDSFAGQMARAIGFGITSDNGGVPQNQTLSHVHLPVITNAECQETFGSYVISSMLCISGADGRSTCSGDSGGPLVIGNLLIGLTSFGTSTCEGGFPEVFTRITSFYTWIRQRL